MLRQYELVDLVKSYDPDADEDALNRAYVAAMKQEFMRAVTRIIPIRKVAVFTAKNSKQITSVIAGFA